METRYFYLNTSLILMFIFLSIYLKLNFFLPLILFFIIIYIVKYRKKSILLFFVLFFSLILNLNFEKKEINKNYNHIAVVDEIYNDSVVVKEDNQKYYLMDVNINLNKGDLVEYNCYYKKADSNDSFEIFIKSNKCTGYGYAKDLNILYKNSDFRSNLINSLYESNTIYSDFCLLILYGQETENGYYLSETLNQMGISYLFVISGFHISLIFIIIEYICKKINIKNKYKLVFSSLITLQFLYLLYFPKTGLRAFLTIFLIRLNIFSKTESLSLVWIIYFLINPWLLFTNSMILSFSITYAIYFYKPNRFSLIDSINVSLFAFYISLCTISTWENKHNLFSPIISIAMTPIASMIYITSILFLPFKFLWPIVNYFYYLYLFIILIISHLHFFFYTNKINFFIQIILIFSSILYVFTMRNYKKTMLANYFLISLLFFII